MEAQRNLFRENDTLEQEELALYKQAGPDAEQVQVVCHQEMMAIAEQQSELIVRKTKLDTLAADITTQIGFEEQFAADAIERQLRAFYER